MRRKPLDTGSAMAMGVDHLLRQYKHLRTNPGEFGQWVPPSNPGVDLWDATFTVAAYDARTEVRKAADYACSGSFDNVEISAALLQAGALPSARVMLSEGHFIMPTDIEAVTLVVPEYTTLWGLGSDITFISYWDTSDFDLQITYATGSSLGRFSIVELTCGA